MNRGPILGWTLALALSLASAGAPLQAQDAPAPEPAGDAEPRALTIAEYDRWRSIQGAAISADGAWVTYTFAGRDRADTLYVAQVDSDIEYEIVHGSGARFSDDSQWVAYFLSAEEGDDEEEGERDRQVELRHLESGETVQWDRVASFEFAVGSRALLIRKARADGDADHSGTEVILRHLTGTQAGSSELLGSVNQSAFNASGTHLAYTVDAPDRDGNGVYLIDVEGGARSVLDSENADYSRLTWDEDGMAIAALRGDEVEGMVEKANVLLTFAVSGWSATYDPVADPAFPSGMVLSEKGTLLWSRDRARVFFGVREQAVAADRLCAASESDDDEMASGHTIDDPALSDPLICSDIPVANVDIWHWQDEAIQSVQENRANGERNRTFRAVLHLDEARVVQLGDHRVRNVTITDPGDRAIGFDPTPYVSDWRPAFNDIYEIDLGTGDRTTVLRSHLTTYGASPDGRHLLYWQEGHIWAYDFERDEHRNLTESAPVSFVNAEDDHTGERPSYGIAGWAADGEGVILNHRYDLYLQPLDGSEATNLTGGRGASDEIRFRYVRTDSDEEWVDLDEPLLLSAYGQWTKKAGFFRLDGDDLTELVYDDARFGNPIKASDSDRLMLTRQDFRTFPDYHLTTLAMAEWTQLTDANPHQSEFRWGHRILFDYTNDDGVPLQGTLAIPDGYEPGDQLPMLVHFYEKLSQNLNSYPTPRYASSPNYAGYVSNGYLVMEPDVHFRTRTSHSDMLESVEAAVAAVIELGYVDPDRVGLHGHSYSGGGASYISTQSEMFAAIVAGAAPINLRSEFNQIWPGSGSNNHRYDIYGQGRYGTDPFTDLQLYLDQSPVTHAPTMDTPLLYLHGVDDAIVPWIQGLEFYNALRFNEKPIIWLSYPGEGHGLGRHENRVDFQTRMRQFFDHYLKDAPAPRWMTEGRSFIEKERALGTNEGGSRGGR